MRVSVLGAEKGDPQILFERHAGRHDLGENCADLLTGERSRVLREHPVDYLADAAGLINRRAVGMLEAADLDAQAAAVIQQADQVEIDRVDLRAQPGERGRRGIDFPGWLRTHGRERIETNR